VQNHTHFDGYCRVSSGFGFDHQLHVEVIGRPANTSATPAEWLFRYDPPTVLSVAGERKDTGTAAIAPRGVLRVAARADSCQPVAATEFLVMGGFNIVVRGTSFTADGEVFVSGKKCERLQGNHTAVRVFASLSPSPAFPRLLRRLP
jgi:hypothetical protein